MVQSSKTFRIFVSSTFSDLKEERNILQKYAFPLLRELCAQHGFKFQAIDLRWGVSEEAGLDQQTMKICLEEIERSQKVSPKPNFIVLLGNRYGWRPLPAEIEAKEFKRILKEVSVDEKELLLWKEEQPEDKKGWYRLDENAVPAIYCLQSRKGIYKKYVNWTPVEQELHSILLEAASKLDLSEDDFLKYFASATEQEIVHGSLKVKDAEDHVFCFFRNIENLPDNKDFVDLDSDGNVDDDAQEKLENLKEKLSGQLPESHIKEYNAEWTDDDVSKDHLKALCNDVYEKLEKIILEKIEEIEEIEPLDQEIQAHEEFGKDRAKFFTGRTEILNDISTYLENGNGSPLAIYGESGSGKSALMAKAVIDAKEYLDAQIISRFIGATPKSTDIRSLLENLCEQIYRDFNFEEKKQGRLMEIYGDDEETQNKRKEIEDEFSITSEIQKLPETFKRFLSLIPHDNNLILFLDALDQLSSIDNAHSLNWLHDNLPDNVHIVVSSLEGTFYDILKNKIPEENLLKLEKLEKEDGEDLLNLWLNDGKRTLQPKQRNEVIKKFQIEGLPLYLKLVFEEAKNWKSYTKTPELESSIPKIIKQMFNKLSDDSNHGKLIVDCSLGYLAASKNGLSEDEIIDVLSRDKNVFYDFMYRARSEPTEILNAIKEVLTEDEEGFKEDSGKLFEKLQKDKDFCFNVFDRMDKSKISYKLPVAIWSRLYFDLEPYLTERSADKTSLLAFYHRQLGEVVAEEFLKNNVKVEKHHALAEYFFDQDLKIQKNSEIVYNVRKVSELAYQESHGELWDKLEETLCDLKFVEAKCAVGMTYDLIEDYNMALVMHPEAQEEKRKKLEHEKRVDKYVKDLIAYSEGKTTHLEIIPSVEIWDEEKIRKDAQRIINNPTGLDSIKVFSQFVKSQSYLLNKFGYVSGFCTQQAFNYAKSSPVFKNAKEMTNAKFQYPMILIDENLLPEYYPHSGHLLTLEGHITEIKSVKITPNGKNAISGSKDATARVWDLETGKQIEILEGHKKPLIFVNIDGKSGITSDEYNLLFWDLDTGKQMQLPRKHEKRATAVAITPNGKIAVTGIWADRTICVRNLDTGKQTQLPKGHTKEIDSIAISSDGNIAISGSWDNTVRVWDIQTGQQIQILKTNTNVEAITPDGKKGITSDYHNLYVWDLDTRECLCIIKDDNRISTIFTLDLKKAIIQSGNKAFIYDLETGQKIQTLQGHNKEINTIAITPDGETAISGSKDQNIIIWDLITGKTLKLLVGHSNEIKTVSITPDGKKAISGSSDCTARVWDLETGKSLHILKHMTHVLTVEITPDCKKGITSDAYYLRFWDLETGELIKTIEHSEWVYVKALTPDGKHAITQSSDNICIWDIKTEKKIKTLNTPGMCMAITPDGKKVITGSPYRIIRVWDIESGKQIQLPKGHTDYVNAVAITADGKKILSGGDNSLCFWDAETEKLLQKLEGHKSWINAVDITPDGKRAISGSSDKTVCIWDLNTGKLQKTLKGHTSSVNDVAITHDGKIIVSGSSDGTIKFWNWDSGTNLKTVGFHAKKINAVSVTPDGKKAISGSSDNTARVWDLETFKQLKKQKGHIDRVFAVAVTANGKIAVSGGWDKTVRLWNLETGESKILEGHEDPVMVINITPDGKKAISGSNDSNLCVWDLETGKLLKTLEGHTATVISLAISPDGKKALSGSNDKTLRIWDLNTGKLLKTLEGHTHNLKYITITSDGKKVITGSIDKTVRVWDLETGEQLQSLKHIDFIYAVAITPDGKKVITGCRDLIVRLWDLMTGKLLKTLEGHLNIVVAAAITPDGKIAITGDVDGNVYVWDLETGERLNTMENHTHKINSVNSSLDGKRAISIGDDIICVWDLETGNLVSISKRDVRYYPLSTNAKNILLWVTKSGNVRKSHLVNLSLGFPITTAIRMWLSREDENIDYWDDNITADCDLCGNHFKVPDNILNVIRKIEKKYRKSNGWIDDEAWEDPRLISECPYCHEKLKFNPFIVDNSKEKKSKWKFWK